MPTNFILAISLSLLSFFYKKLFYLTLESAQQRGKRRNKVSQIVLDIVKEHSQIEFS